MLKLAIVTLIVCCGCMTIDLFLLKKQIRSLRSELDNLASFSLKLIQDRSAHE